MKLIRGIAGLLLTAALILSGCEDMPHMNVQGGTHPRFVFHGSQVSYLLVYRIPPRYLNGGIPVDELEKDIANKQWLIEGDHDAKIPIDYGVTPRDMKELISPKPLVEGVIYMVQAYMGAGDIGANSGQNFMIKNGTVVEIADAVDKKTLSPEQSK
jgi:hypothetical protein